VTLSSFVLVGTIISYDSVLSTVEFNLNPATNGGPAIAILQNVAIPCNIKIGQTIYVVKEESQDHATITCRKDEK